MSRTFSSSPARSFFWFKLFLMWLVDANDLGKVLVGGMIGYACDVESLTFESSAWRACRAAHFTPLLSLFVLCSVREEGLLVICVY